jgi:hypothetical protein
MRLGGVVVKLSRILGWELLGRSWQFPPGASLKTKARCDFRRNHTGLVVCSGYRLLPATKHQL